MYWVSRREKCCHGLPDANHWRARLVHSIGEFHRFSLELREFTARDWSAPERRRKEPPRARELSSRPKRSASV